MEFGFVWFVLLVVGMFVFMLFVLIKSIVVGMGVMFVCLIVGIILSSMVFLWYLVKYLFMVNLNLIFYL